MSHNLTGVGNFELFAGAGPMTGAGVCVRAVRLLAQVAAELSGWTGTTLSTDVGHIREPWLFRSNRREDCGHVCSQVFAEIA